VTFLDCTGVRALTIAIGFAPAGCPVIIRSLSPIPGRILGLLDLDLETFRKLSPGPEPRDRLADRGDQPARTGPDGVIQIITRLSGHGRPVPTCTERRHTSASTTSSRQISEAQQIAELAGTVTRLEAPGTYQGHGWGAWIPVPGSRKPTGCSPTNCAASASASAT
jgi:hypothetical protein